MIHWQGIGSACNAMTRRENARSMKLLNGWLNTDRQKGLFDQAKGYPCCGWEEETTTHMFQCREPTTKKA